MTELQILAQKKYNKIIMGNGMESRQLRLYNIHNLLEKPTLTEADIKVLEHFMNATAQEIAQTTYVANTAIYPSSWGHTTTVLKQKTAK